jgi:integrase
MTRALPDTIAGSRDRCLLLLGFASALRRSELSALNVDDLSFVDLGIVITVRRSKTDQQAHGRQIGVPRGGNPETCPVRTTREWLARAAISSGPVFRPIDRHHSVAVSRLSDRSVATIVKRAAEAAGLDPARFAGHSLRSGFATAAAQAGATEMQIMRQTGHRSTDVLRRYIKPTTLFDQNPAAQVGL